MMVKIVVLYALLMCSCTMMSEGLAFSRISNEIKNKRVVFTNKISITYGQDDRQYVNLYFPEKLIHNQVLWYTHGGGWKIWRPEYFEFVAKFFVDKGYIVAMPSFRLVPLHTYPHIISDIFEAYNKTDNYLDSIGYTDRSYVLMGASAGANLSALLYLDTALQNKYQISSERFDGLISFAGVLDFNNCKGSTIVDLIIQYTNDKESYNKSDANANKHLNTSKKGRIYCMHSRDDGTVDYVNSVTFVQNAEKLGHTAKLFTIEDATHDESYTELFQQEKLEQKVLLGWLEEMKNK